MACIETWGGAKLPSYFGLCLPEEDLLYIIAYIRDKNSIMEMARLETLK